LKSVDPEALRPGRSSLESLPVQPAVLRPRAVRRANSLLESRLAAAGPARGRQCFADICPFPTGGGRERTREMPDKPGL
jgi:hypothetical protein